MRSTVRKSDPCYVLDCTAKAVVIADLGEVWDGHLHRVGDELVEITLCDAHARMFVVDPDGVDNPMESVNVVLDPRLLHGWCYLIGFDADGTTRVALMPDPAAPAALHERRAP